MHTCHPYLYQLLNLAEWKIVLHVIKLKDFFDKKLTKEEINKIWEVENELWLPEISFDSIDTILDLTDEELKEAKELKLVSLDHLKAFMNIWRRSSRDNLKWCLTRANDSLNGNRTLLEEDFKSLFWKWWKFGKQEINQEKLWMCYLYTWLEMLKKNQLFDTLVKTNIETISWWYLW